MISKILIVGLGGFLGANLRFLINDLFQRSQLSRLPLGTLSVNLIGSFLIGLLLPLILRSKSFSEELRAGIIIGFLGALTTFSTFSFESYQLILEDKWGLAAVNIMMNVFGTLVAVFIGVSLARWL